MAWRVLADIVAAVHAAYIAFVVFGFAAILAGSAWGWRWVRNLYFRAAHLAAILFVCFEALGGWVCPLTSLEDALRLRGGEAGYARDFIGYLLDSIIFYDAPQWVFTVLYLGFGALVFGTLWLIPPRWPKERTQ
jgi:polyferredoxin